MHAEAVKIPDPVYKAALKPTAAASKDGYIVMIWQCLDARNYTRIRAVFP
jgi:hypothetical protein